MTPYQKRIHKDRNKAVAWAVKHAQRFPEAEPYIATSPETAVHYAIDVIKGRFPEAEEVIAKDPRLAYYYAINVLKGRFPEAEPAIAKNLNGADQWDYHMDPWWAKEYLKAFPQAKLEWAMNGWIDWLDL